MAKELLESREVSIVSRGVVNRKALTDREVLGVPRLSIEFIEARNRRIGRQAANFRDKATSASLKPVITDNACRYWDT